MYFMMRTGKVMAYHCLEHDTQFTSLNLDYCVSVLILDLSVTGSGFFSSSCQNLPLSGWKHQENPCSWVHAASFSHRVSSPMELSSALFSTVPITFTFQRMTHSLARRKTICSVSHFAVMIRNLQTHQKDLWTRLYQEDSWAPANSLPQGNNFFFICWLKK